MKKTLLLIISMVVALWAAATDRFYIQDFTISPGDTVTVSIQLDNETEYTAFQTDIYIPVGLTIEQENGEYIFDLTSRKAHDHNIASQLQADGAIRVMSYSPGIKGYSGNSGPLVTFMVTADNDFTGTAVIQMKTILLITTSGVEIPFDNEECHVTLTAEGIKGDVNDDGYVTIADVTVLIDYLLGSSVLHFNSDNADVNGNGEITIADVTALIDMLLAGDN